MSEDTLVFDSLDPIEVPVKIAGKDYLLVEASEEAAVAYNNARLSSATVDPDSKKYTTDLSRAANVEPVLVSHCLFSIRMEGELTVRTPVSEAQVRKMPHRIIKPLYVKIKEISDLDEDLETVDQIEKEITRLQQKVARLKAEPAKNLPDSSTDTSDLRVTSE